MPSRWWLLRNPPPRDRYNDGVCLYHGLEWLAYSIKVPGSGMGAPGNTLVTVVNRPGQHCFRLMDLQRGALQPHQLQWLGLSAA
jgi:hypothetical protein